MAVQATTQCQAFQRDDKWFGMRAERCTEAATYDVTHRSDKAFRRYLCDDHASDQGMLPEEGRVPDEDGRRLTRNESYRVKAV